MATLQDLKAVQARKSHVLCTRKARAFLEPLRISFRYQMSRLRKWRALFRNVRERIRLQSSTWAGWVDLGPAFHFEDGHWQENKGTTARVEGIEKLKAIHPWADAVDAQMFLIGFAEGEKRSLDYACRDSIRESEHT